MVILKNIIKTDVDISADYYIEGQEPTGFMRMRMRTLPPHSNQKTGPSADGPAGLPYISLKEI